MGEFQRALAGFDAANAQDPKLEIVDGIALPRELLYAKRMSACLQQFKPNASDTLRLAARSQHIQRWKIPRDNYPSGRQGYHRWRRDLARFHAQMAGKIMREAGYDEVNILAVQRLLCKENLKKDPEAQCLEDVICLVFLSYYLSDFARRHDDNKLMSILGKTWRKMSPRGQKFAATLELAPTALKLVEKTLLGQVSIKAP